MAESRPESFYAAGGTKTFVVLKIVAFVLPLGLDTLAIAIAFGLRGLSPLRPAFTFAIFEGIMPIFGIALARIVSLRFETAAVVTGGIILVGIGFNAIREAMLGDEGRSGVSFSSFRASFAAGLGISTDELAIGFPLGASGLPIAIVLAAIASQALLVTAFGIAIGNRVGSALGGRASRYAGLAAGVAFSAVGLWLILEVVLAK